MTAVMGGVYILALMENVELRGSWVLIPFTLLLLIHIVAHWNVDRIISKPGGKLAYILLQGALAFIIVYISHFIGMIFALHMALIGETIGIVRTRLATSLAIAYYVALLLINFSLITSIQATLPSLVGIIPAVVFVGLYVVMYNRQNEAREQAQALAAKLETANRQLTDYAARVEDLTIANERQRMARELHDTLSQGLAGLILQLEAADAHLGNHNDEKARSIIANTMLQARATLADARHAIDDLRQAALGELDSDIRAEISRFEDATGIPCNFRSEPTSPLPDPLKETILRSVTEALTNIANHAEAHHVAIQIQDDDHGLLVTIQDDGTGFDASSIPAGHYGLLGIRERVRLARGTFDLQSEKGKGTTLKIRVPLAADGTVLKAASG